MVTIETVVSFAIRDRTVMNQLNGTLKNDLVIANPFYRRLVTFADDFLDKEKDLPQGGDWELWIDSLDAGMTRDGTREALQRLLAVDLTTYKPEFFASEAHEQLKLAAANVARARMNEVKELKPETIIALAEQIQAIGSAAWPEPLPLVDSAPAPLPLDALPEVIRKQVESIAGATQTPTDMAAVLALAAVSVTVQGKAMVAVRSGWIEPLNIYVIGVLPPAGRKSVVFREIFAPLQEAEIKMTAEVMPKRAQAEVNRAVAERAMKEMTKRAALDPKHDDYVPPERLEEANITLLAAKIPPLPRLNASDATPEALIKIMAEQGGRLAVWSPEGDPLSLFGGRYSEGELRAEVLKKAWTGLEPIRVDRIGRPGEFIRKPALTLALTLQPAFLVDLRAKEAFVGVGVFGRILWVYPDSGIGHRLTGSVVPELDEGAAVEWTKLLNQLLGSMPKDVDDDDGAYEPHMLNLNIPARRILHAFEAEMEEALGPSGRYAGIEHWAGKLCGNAIRLAALLHLVRVGEDITADLWKPLIGKEAMEGGVHLARALAQHALRIFATLGQDRRVTLAQYVLERARGIPAKKRTISMIHQQVKDHQGLGTVDEVTAALQLLRSHNLVRWRRSEASGKVGRRKSPTVELHPHVLTTTHAEEH